MNSSSYETEPLQSILWLLFILFSVITPFIASRERKILTIVLTVTAIVLGILLLAASLASQ